MSEEARPIKRMGNDGDAAGLVFLGGRREFMKFGKRVDVLYCVICLHFFSTRTKENEDHGLVKLLDCWKKY